MAWKADRTKELTTGNENPMIQTKNSQLHDRSSETTILIVVAETSNFKYLIFVTVSAQCLIRSALVKYILHIYMT